MTLKEIKLSLAKLVLQRQSVMSDKGMVYFDSLEVDEPIFQEDSESNLVPAESGTYKIEGKVVEVLDGIITEVKDEEVEVTETQTEMEVDETEIPAPAEESTDVEYVSVNQFNELVEKFNELVSVVRSLTENVNEVEEKVELVDSEFSRVTKTSVGTPVSKTVVEQKGGSTNAERFFNGWKQ